jgi:hypothetical protein
VATREKLVAGFLIRRGGYVELVLCYDTIFVAELKRAIPADSRTYCPETRTWQIELTRAAAAVSLASKYFGPLEHLVPAWEQWPGHTLDDCQQALRRAYSDHATLYLLPEAPAALIQAAYRALALLHHPDRVGGGGHAVMVELNGAYERLKSS